MAESDQHEQLMTAMHNMVCSEPPLPFARQYIMLPKPPMLAGQAAVCLALSKTDGLFQYAIKCVTSYSKALCLSFDLLALCV